MKAVLSLMLIFCAIWESAQLTCHQIEHPDKYGCGRRVDGDELIFEKYDNLPFYNPKYIDFVYPSKDAIVSFYKITQIVVQDYKNNLEIDVTGGQNQYKTRIRITKTGGNGEPVVKVWIYGIYVGPCN